MLERLARAMNARDAGRVAALFAEDYRSSQPIHPGRGFGGRAQVLENWAAVFRGVPDFAADLLDQAVAGDTEWGEWSWRGTHVDGATFAMRGVTILHVADVGLISAARLYMEPVDPSGEKIEAAVRDLYRPPAQ